MTEEEWLAEQKRPKEMLSRLLQLGREHRAEASERKLRLFVCGCCRLMWDPLDDIVLRPALAVAERFADNEAEPIELQKSFKKAVLLLNERMREPGARRASHATEIVTIACAANAKSAAFRATRFPVDLADRSMWGIEGEAIVRHLLRDIFGNPFRPVAVKREWVAWANRTVEAVARSIYEERAFDRMPILADALEEAGCVNAGVLLHCRGDGRHVRGCWVVDLLLGKV